MKKTYVVAGGANGIGAAIAGELADQYSVFVIDAVKPEAPIDAVTYLQADLTQPDQVEIATSKLPDEIAGLVLSVGVMRRGTIFDSSEQDYDLLMNTNVKSAWLVLQALEPKLQNIAQVLQISSGHVLDPEPDPGIYTLSKKAVTSLIEVLRLTKPDYDIRVVYPGPVDTNLLATGRTPKQAEDVRNISIQPAELAEKVMRLLGTDHTTLKFNPEKWDYDYE